MKLLFATDLHGRNNHLQQLVDLAGQHAPDLLIMGGDVLPDADPADPLGSQVRFLVNDMTGYLGQLRRTCPAARVATVLGNHDWLCTYQAMQDLQQQGWLHILQLDNSLTVGGFAFLGYSYAPPCPYVVKDFEKLDFPGQPYLFDGGLVWDSRQRRPRQVDGAHYLQGRSSIREDLRRAPRLDTPDWVLVAHAPPGNTHLDVLPHVGHVGSRSVDEFLRDRQPALSLHGHIHESAALTGHYWQHLGTTIAVNPGQREDTLAAVLVELTTDIVTLTPLAIEGAGTDPVVLSRSLTGRPV